MPVCGSLDRSQRDVPAGREAMGRLRVNPPDGGVGGKRFEPQGAKVAKRRGAGTTGLKKVGTGGSPNPLSRRVTVRVERGLNSQGAKVAKGRRAGTLDSGFWIQILGVLPAGINVGEEEI